MSAAEGISEPLLGDSQQERECEDNVDLNDMVREADEEHGGCFGCTVSIVFEDDDDDEAGSNSKNGEDGKAFSWFDHVVVWIILPALLFLQFGMAFFMSDVEVVTGLRWSVVNYSILLFVATSVLYRQAAVDCKWTSSFIILLPEIIMDVILGLVLFDKIVMAFLFMLVSMLGLAIFVVVCSIRILVLSSMNNGDDEDDDEEDEVKDSKKEKLIITRFEGGRVPDAQTE
jgi:hypothetical protein